MRKLMAGVCAAALLLAAGACQKKKRHANPAATVEEEAGLEASIAVADPAAASQILHGFHAAENPSWRWSMKRFGVSLRPPDTLAGQTVWLEMDYTVPEPAAAKMTGATITAAVDESPLPPDRIAGGGSRKYRQPVPTSALRGKEAVIVEFTLDRTFGPNAEDSRELGLVISRIGFAAQ
jgi:hypothetical protein